MTDPELLGGYLRGNNADFTVLVERHMRLVYFAALRQVGGDAHAAKDVAQTVFIALARKAPSIQRHPALEGWLYSATRHAARKMRRGAGRRSTREKIYQMNLEPETPATDGGLLAPLIDELLGTLRERDRELVLLRYLAGKTYAEIAGVVGLGSDACRMRVERSLEKLRHAAAERGWRTGTAAFAVALAEIGEGKEAMPLGLAGGIAVRALEAVAIGGLAGGSGIALVGAKTIWATISVALSLGIGGFVLHETRLRKPAVTAPAPRQFDVQPPGSFADAPTHSIPLAHGVRLRIRDQQPLVAFYAQEMLNLLSNDKLKLTAEQRSAVVGAYIHMRLDRVQWEVNLASVDTTDPNRTVVTIPAYAGERLLAQFGAEVDQRAGAGVGDRVFATYGPAIISANRGFGEKPQTITLERNIPGQPADVTIRNTYSYSLSVLFSHLGRVGNTEINFAGPISISSVDTWNIDRGLSVDEFLRDAIPTGPTAMVRP